MDGIVRLCVLTLFLIGEAAFAVDVPSGRDVFVQKCASCHGEAGQGIATEYPNPLIGDKSLKELTQYIDKSMPKGSPDDCNAPEAASVAAYIYDAFYSPTAQARNQPARIELSRLTVRQYQETVADLVGSFRWNNRWNEERGLKGEYYKSRKFWEKNDRVIERIDPTIALDFGEAGPLPEKIEPKEYSARWRGAVRAIETGDYEFVIRSQNAVKLWINDTETPLIDFWVRSGNDNEFRGRVRLLGGRAYPVRIEFLKSREAQGSLSLMWVPPHGVLDVIPARCLSPQDFPEVCVVQAAFPPDDRSIGYERGLSVSKEWDQATTESAIEVADYVLAHLRELTKSKESDSDRLAKLQAFCRTFAERAFRQGLTPEQIELYVDRHFVDVDPETAVKRSLLLILKSPRFLFREVGNSSDAFAAASRLSFTLWDTLPDQALTDAAAAQQLSNPDQIRSQAWRMVGDDRTRAKLMQFLRQWLKTDQLGDLAKDPARYPEFDAGITADLRTSLELFLEEAAWAEQGSFRQLLLTDSLYLNGRLARFYNFDLPPDSPFQKVSLDAQARSGVLSHPFLLSGFAYTASSSPIHRGVFLSRSLLGRALRPPPEAVAPLAPELHAELTTRERVNLQTQPEACQSCHAMINPLGFTLEHFDAVGRYRQEEQGKPIDARGAYITRAGESVSFNGVRDLANFLAGSPETHAAFVEQTFQYFVKQPIRAYGPDQLDHLTKTFAEREYRFRDLLVEIAVVAASTPRTSNP